MWLQKLSALNLRQSKTSRHWQSILY